MVEWIHTYLTASWLLVAEMAPYLLLGFLAAGLLHWLIRADRVRHWLGRPGVAAVVKACLIGTPMPLCSCSVIPVAASLRKQGASRGATAAFLSATPQTGIDSIFATYGLMGGCFAAIRVVVAFITGLTSGLLVDWLIKEPTPAAPKPTSSGLAPITESTQSTFNSLRPFSPTPDAVGSVNSIDLANLSPHSTSTAPGAPQSCQCSAAVPEKSDAVSFTAAMQYGWLRLPADLAPALLIGLLLAGAVAAWLPADLLSGASSHGLMAFVMATIISVPLYVCATASIPLAYSFILAGLSPGAALVFLIVGPATNTATIAAVWSLLGRKATVIYLSSLIVIAWLAGWILNALDGANITTEQLHLHGMHACVHWYQHLAGGLLVSVLVFAQWNHRRAQASTSRCCAK